VAEAAGLAAGAACGPVFFGGGEFSAAVAATAPHSSTATAQTFSKPITRVVFNALKTLMYRNV
jgi:hypothetical protein